MKYNVIDYLATDPVEIVSFRGYVTVTDIPEQATDTARVVIEGLADVMSLGELVRAAVAKFKGVDDDAEAIWASINPPPKNRQDDQPPITESAPPVKPKTKRKSASKFKKKTDPDLQSSTDASTSSSNLSQSGGETTSTEIVTMNDKEKAKAAKQKEKDKAAKQKEKDKAAKQKEKDKAAKQKEKDKAAKLKERKAKAKERQKAKDQAAKDKAAAKAKGEKPPRVLPSTLPREGSKAGKLLALISRKGGATFAEMQKATGWKEMRGTAGDLARRAGKKLTLLKEEGKVSRWAAV